MGRPFKTELCKNYIKGKCRYGINCIFAHGKEELRCKFYILGKCKYEGNCNFIHEKESINDRDNTQKRYKRKIIDVVEIDWSEFII